MSQASLTEQLERAEALMLGDADEAALDLLGKLAEDAEEYVDRNCPTTDELQWFSFPTLFERLAYRRVENDPRELRDVGEPFDRLYADLALASVRTGDYQRATEALKQSIRWNPMDCGARLDLAELFLTNGDANEYLGLTYTVFERASDVRHLARAFANFARWFEQTGRDDACAAALRCARKLDARDATADALIAQAAGTPRDPDNVTDEQATQILEAEGLPDGANAEIAVCLLMCATDAAEEGQRDVATMLTLRARDLVGSAAAGALIELIHASDAAGDPAGEGGADA